MLYSHSNINIILINVLLMVFYHLAVLWLCKNLDSKFFDSERMLYRTRSWEKNGFFYIKYLKIKKWKDYLPQYISKNGFSKKNLLSITKLETKYIDNFILETCRAEWNHFVCCLYFIISFTINPMPYAVIFSAIPIVINAPFIIIQRYNRIRLKKLTAKSKIKCKFSPISK
ncbi:MAG: hypothetical protein ACI4PR_03390 [Acutalibacteraceae bacterium]